MTKILRKRRNALIYNRIKYKIGNQPEPLLLWWLQHHEFRLEIIAAVSGVTPRTVDRWVETGRLPRNVRAMLEQIQNGPAVCCSLSRGGCVRWEWRPVLGPLLNQLEFPF